MCNFLFFQVKTRGGYKLKKANTNSNNDNNHKNNCLLYNVKIDFSYISQLLYKQLQRCQREQAINYCNDYTLKKLFLVQ